ncbi:MAG TPA: helix-turn-helix transcriptional regulator [Thermoanaerobaculia bacterium]|nr:helix-turn-helix transcriptional regulator [Thermoanaerobaculia bacterium]HUM29081.1 helix-turn-helix transcriptional regulator [Thermoanaerobaculia bacterium]HXK67363.1 helix-turn-helix transcriptional regulator [Thermoanaerobaculia bacterium]
MAQQKDQFIKRVKTVRKQLQMSQAQLAHALGVSFATVNRWENGKTAPSTLALRQFALFCREQSKKGKLPHMKVEP